MPAKRQPVSVYNGNAPQPQGYAKAVIDGLTAPENRSVLTAVGLFAGVEDVLVAVCVGAAGAVDATAWLQAAGRVHNSHTKGIGERGCAAIR
ncbi:hypothetical protein W97_04076 [Coniosporium apollinis CBS 100218]|uniref:Uncharacterized protein n=1 Tax=Coniosporium apollinis (strain CBS 100218) TaxID=1168221 RepID=R7YSD4_CONA1|nr:uncharacterized protein W97_04076 [Coniosporium apollinis CBS 100218]EON64842.1 hypothetical protein W97_04076 [Coniosporium apollinis CBS 100218]